MCSRIKTLSNCLFTCLLLFLCLFFFGVYEVDAVGYQKTLNVPSGYLWQGTQSYPTINSYTHFNQTFKGFQVSSGGVSGVGFRLSMSDFDDFDSGYDFTFFVSMANDPASVSGHAPQALFANTFCSVEPIGYYESYPEYRSNISGYFYNAGGSGYQNIMPRDNNGVMGWKNEIFSPTLRTDYASSYYYVMCNDIQLATNSNLLELKTSFMPSRSGTEYSVSTTYYMTKNSSSQIRESMNQNTEAINNQTDLINSDDTSDAEESSSDFFDNFQTTDHGGLSGVISAPLRLINSLASSTCSPLEFPLPFVEEDVALPCMSSIYTTYFGSFFTLYQLITTGLIGYWVVVKCFARVKGIQDPKDDRIEVFDL